MDFGALAIEVLNLKVAAIIALVFLPLERVLPMHQQELRRSGWADDLVYLFLNGALIRLLMLPVLAGGMLLSALLIPASLIATVHSQPLWLQLVEVILLADLGFYGVHRLAHALPAYWRLHAIHHSSERLDSLATFRVHPLDQLISASASTLPILALGFSPWAFGIYALIYRWHSILLHSNIRLPLGPVSWLIATPAFHHWHHSAAPEARDKNFAGQIALWDVVFGTRYMPKGQIVSGYGIEDPVPAGYVDQLAHPFRTRAVRQPSPTGL